VNFNDFKNFDSSIIINIPNKIFNNLYFYIKSCLHVNLNHIDFIHMDLHNQGNFFLLTQYFAISYLYNLILNIFKNLKIILFNILFSVNYGIDIYTSCNGFLINVLESISCKMNIILEKSDYRTGIPI